MTDPYANTRTTVSTPELQELADEHGVSQAKAIKAALAYKRNGGQVELTEPELWAMVARFYQRAAVSDTPSQPSADMTARK